MGRDFFLFRFLPINHTSCSYPARVACFKKDWG